MNTDMPVPGMLDAEPQHAQPASPFGRPSGEPQSQPQANPATASRKGSYYL